MGIPPEIWGPNLWGTLHTLCLTETITHEFVQEFARVIPCPTCAIHFKDLLEEFPLPDTDRFEWSVLIHNQVNDRLGKPIIKVEDARRVWSSRPSSDFYFKIIIAILIVLAILFARRK